MGKIESERSRAAGTGRLAAQARGAGAARAKLILRLDERVSRDATMNELGCDSRFIATWKARFAEEPLAEHPNLTRHFRRDPASD